MLKCFMEYKQATESRLTFMKSVGLILSWLRQDLYCCNYIDLHETTMYLPQCKWDHKHALFFHKFSLISGHISFITWLILMYVFIRWTYILLPPLHYSLYLVKKEKKYLLNLTKKTFQSNCFCPTLLMILTLVNMRHNYESN